ncbi:MauE/DoxX family redox-associated membrane protein [Flocculibacter collagenilyticus]|uniref:MauE/DoxX family redox-associated membrane protein n=1 Tax=Flocculibacter collagenilyticus TaxID=2744479 RepID=UPI0018F27DA5|nr:glutaredoxin [Flocculibacter collagenilyticus]
MTKTATLYRMHNDKHICPFGLKAKDLLQREGYQVEDHKLTSREQTDQFKQEHEVKTTPQAFINGDRIGGYDDLRKHFDKGEAGQTGETYTPVMSIFAVALLMAVAFVYSTSTTLLSMRVVELFIALSMAILAIQKLRDLYAFSNSFITYDLLAMKVVRYAYVYPFVEAYVGIGMIAGLPAYMVAPFSLFIGTIGAISVFKAVYLDKRDLKCACVGGNSNVPLGFVSLTENLFMIAAGIWMLVR